MRQLMERHQRSSRWTTEAELDLVIPALNEEHRIGPTIAAVIQTAHECELNLRILVVDNGSVDATAEVASRHFSSSVPRRGDQLQNPGQGSRRPGRRRIGRRPAMSVTVTPIVSRLPQP